MFRMNLVDFHKYFDGFIKFRKHLNADTTRNGFIFLKKSDNHLFLKSFKNGRDDVCVDMVKVFCGYQSTVKRAKRALSDSCPSVQWRSLLVFANKNGRGFILLFEEVEGDIEYPRSQKWWGGR